MARSTANSDAWRDNVGRVRQFTSPGSTRAIRHRCVAFRAPTAELLAAAGAPGAAPPPPPPANDVTSSELWCGYAYELLVETALLARVPVQAYASELVRCSARRGAAPARLDAHARKQRLRPASSGDGQLTVEWLATLAVKDEKIIGAVSEVGRRSARCEPPDTSDAVVCPIGV